MKLSKIIKDCHGLENFKLLRDAEFASLGYVSHRINTMPFLAFAGSEKFINLALKNPLVTCIITTSELAEKIPSPIGVIATEDPVRGFYQLHKYIVQETELYWTNFENEIDESAKISPHAIIATKNVRIGRNTIIEEGVIIKERSIIGDNCVLRSGCIVSTEGFEFKEFDGNLEFIPHGSGVKIGNSVIAHAGCKFDRGLFGDPTRVGDFSCLDNMIHVAHGVSIGRNCIIAANAVFAAAVVMEDGARIDPNATIAHEVLIGKNAYVTMGAVVTKDVAEGTRVSGNFAYDHGKFMRNFLGAVRN